MVNKTQNFLLLATSVSKPARLLAFAGEGVVPEQADQVQAPEAGGGGTREPTEEEGEPPHQQMAHRHQAEQL